MKTAIIISTLLLVALPRYNTFQVAIPSPIGRNTAGLVGAANPAAHVASCPRLGVGYVPDGLTEAQYHRLKQQEVKNKRGKNLGQLGPKGFQSRSIQAWQEAYERGETQHQMAPPIGFRKKLREGKVKKDQIPYMVRGGNWDDSDVPGARRRKWSKTDKDYARGGYKKEQSVSILGSGPGFNWTGEKRDPTHKASFPGFS